MELVPVKGMVLAGGGIGSGKSCLVYGIVQQLHQNDPGRAVYCYNFPQDKVHLLPDFIGVTNDEEFPEGAIVVADEAYQKLYAKDHANELNRFMDVASGLARQKGILTFFITQTMRKLTLATVSGVQLTLLKCPDAMATLLDRAELRKLQQGALDAFLAVPPEEEQSATFVFDRRHKELLRGTNVPPWFWTEELSCAWQGVSLRQPTELLLGEKKEQPPQAYLCQGCNGWSYFTDGICERCGKPA